jgi:hypothetical protein
LLYLDRNGIDAEPLLLKAELSRGQLSPDSGGISVASQDRFLEFAAIETNDPLLGLHVAAEMDLRDAGILFYLAAASTTVSESFEHLARYAGTANEAVHLEISQPNRDRGENRSPQLAYVVISRSQNCDAVARTCRRQAKRKDDPRLLRFHNGFHFRATGQLRALAALVIANWRGCTRDFVTIRRRFLTSAAVQPIRRSRSHSSAEQADH